ncbi:hypothetical protein [Dialister micraerophilus]|uniref:Uncharacterized protein n=1 Tax=Dialister micraerophilus UPII 345-E TaxID=910314 RepID=E4LA82_9FIRM|nr:hypothetical protein [Dialister micraerophilus]EFR42301.1 hypothetical protein HMPREF9220_0712 [Dialister micraerophilus UPII 345-E]
MNHNKRTIITVTLVILLLVSLSSIYVGYKLGKTSSRTDEIQTTKRQTTSSKHSGILTQTTAISLTDKTTPEDPDIEISTPITAKLNGKTYQLASVRNGDSENTSVLDENKLRTQRVQVKSELDITPVVEEIAEARYKRTHEIGIGIGYTTNTLTIPISYQYNMSDNKKAIEAIIQINPKTCKIENTILLYKQKI